jgi:L-rhamnose mutarotase
MTRICFTLQIRPEHLDEYKARHREVWPEMRAALSATGWRDYSLFLRPDGLLVGYLVTEDFNRAREAMKSYPVNDLWQQQMAPFFAAINSHADDAMQPLEEVFHLD